MRPGIQGPYRKRPRSQDPALLQPVEVTPEKEGANKETKPKKVWVSQGTTGRLTDLAVTSAKIILAGLCGSALILTIKN